MALASILTTVDYDLWHAASNIDLVPEKISKDSLSKLYHQFVSSMVELIYRYRHSFSDHV